MARRSCIEATIQIVRAEGAGEPIPQRTPCGAWDYDGGLLLTDLTPGVELTLRGAADGYAPREMSFIPFPMPGLYKAVFITLANRGLRLPVRRLGRAVNVLCLSFSLSVSFVLRIAVASVELS